MDDFEHRVDACEARLRAACADAKCFVTGDGRVSEEIAGRLLGLATTTLASKRGDGSGPDWYRLGGNGHKVSYRLIDLARWLEALRVMG